MEDLFWNGLFWNQVIYPEHALDPIGGANLVDSYMDSGECPDYVVCVCLDRYAYLTRERQSEATALAAAMIAERLAEHQRKKLGFTHTNAFYFCGKLGGCTRHSLISGLERLRKTVSASTGLSTTLGLAFVGESSLAGLRRAAQCAVVAQRQKIRSGSDRTYVHEPAFDLAAFSLESYWRTSQRLSTLVRECDPTQVDGVFSEVSRVLFDENYLPLGYLRPILQSYIILMSQAARDVGASEEQVTQETHEYLNRILVTYDYSDLKEILHDAARSFTQHVRDRYYSASGPIASKAEEAVRERLDDADLSLHVVAEDLGVNPSYLSRRFKQEKGVGLTEFINSQRVEWAKRLLLDKKLSVTEIGHTVGFGSIQSFGRVFRAAAGCSPSEYRKRALAS